MKKTLVSILTLIIAALGGGAVATNLGGAGDITSGMATSSTADVGSNGYVTLFNRSVCAARIITTKDVPITLAFATSTGQDLTLSLTDGIGGTLQAASTTVTYDSTLHGCGVWHAYAQGDATTTITVVETH